MDSFQRSRGRLGRTRPSLSQCLWALDGSVRRCRSGLVAVVMAVTVLGVPVTGVFDGVATAGAQQLEDARASARAAMASSNWRQAIDAWTSVLALDPNDAEAKAGLKQAQAMLDQASTIDNVQEDFTLRRERLIVQYNDDLARANAAYEEGGYRKAREAAVTARIRIDRDRGVLPNDRYTEMMGKIDNLLDRIAEAEQLEELAKQEASREEARSAADAERRKERAERSRTINESLQRVRQLQLELKLERSLATK